MNDLRLRTQPSTNADILAVFDRGDVLWLLSWPRVSGGYTWYPAERVATDGALPPLPMRLNPDGSTPRGWVAVAKGDVDWVRPLAARCPSIVNLEQVGAMLPVERVACFGDTTIVLEGVFGCGGCGGAAPGVYKPVWLASPLQMAFLSVDPSEHIGPLALSFQPSGPGDPAEGSIIRVRGHFQDARAERCEVAFLADDQETLVEVPARLAIGVCRQRYVVESYKILGIDPDFPPG